MQEYVYEKKLMGTNVSVSVVTIAENLAQEIGSKALDTITEYEQRFSRFLPTSEVSLLNETKDNVVSEEFFDVLSVSRRLHKETKGVFNPLFQIARQGYDTTYERLSDSLHETKNEPYNTDLDDIEIDEHTRRVVLKKYQRLDFGGILKGYLATKLAHQLKDEYPACTGLIINIGGDLHTLGKDEHNRPFVFNILNPITKEGIPVTITDTSLITSGTYKRTWETSSNSRHHILASDGVEDPHSDIISASIIHPDGAAAEAYAKLFIVSGPEESQKMIGADDLKYLVIKTDGAVLTNIV